MKRTVKSSFSYLLDRFENTQDLTNSIVFIRHSPNSWAVRKFGRIVHQSGDSYYISLRIDPDASYLFHRDDFIVLCYSWR